MRILVGAQYYYPYRSGLTEYARLLAEELAGRGHQVTVLTSRSSQDLPKEDTIRGVRVLRLTVGFKMDRGSFMPSFLTHLARLRRDFDIINLHYPMPECLPAAFLSRNHNLVITYHCDMTLQGSGPMRVLQALYYWFQNHSLKYSRAIAASSIEYAAASAIGSYLDRVIAIPPPIKPLRPVDATRFKEEFGLGEGPIIGFLGRVVFEKGLEDLIKAMDEIKRAFPKSTLMIAGEKERAAGGTITQKLVSLSEIHKNSIFFPGFLEDHRLEEFYSACDVFVLPSVDRLEAFGMVQVEAMLCGTPVVATDRPGMRVPIEKTQMGLLVPPNNPEELAKGILRVLENRATYLMDPSLILSSFGIQKTVDRYERLFADMISP